MQISRGKIELIMGCMFAGKTTELIRRCRKHEIAGKSVFRVKFSADKRYEGEFRICTHGGDSTCAQPVTNLAEIKDSVWQKHDIIAIDEGQFFTDLVEFCEKAANNGKVVIVSSLQGTFLRGVFPNIISLIPKCEKIKKLTAICKLCKQNASFTFRTANKDSQKMIGGDDMYMPLCRDCHSREMNLNKENAFTGDPTIISVDIETKSDGSGTNEKSANTAESSNLELTSESS